MFGLRNVPKATHFKFQSCQLRGGGGLPVCLRRRGRPRRPAGGGQACNLTSHSSCQCCISLRLALSVRSLGRIQVEGPECHCPPICPGLKQKLIDFLEEKKFRKHQHIFGPETEIRILIIDSVRWASILVTAGPARRRAWARQRLLREQPAAGPCCRGAPGLSGRGSTQALRAASGWASAAAQCPGLRRRESRARARRLAAGLRLRAAPVAVMQPPRLGRGGSPTVTGAAARAPSAI